MRIVVLGLSVTSSWGNGHATTYRALLRGLHQRGHHVIFLERDKPWYRENRDQPALSFAQVSLYQSVDALQTAHAKSVREADLVIVGSYVPEGVAVADWVLKTAGGITAFYDIDTPVTLRKLERGDEEYLAARAIPRFGMYLSFTGGPTLRKVEQEFGAKMARAFYCSVDPELYFPEPRQPDWLMGYLGTYSADRQPALEDLLAYPAEQLTREKFAVAGPLYPLDLAWPENVERIEHLAPPQHRAFYNSQKFTLNITRVDMRHAGYSPSVRLFEAAACGTVIVSDRWPGLETLFTPGKEILIARSGVEVLQYLTTISDAERAAIGRAARKRVLAEHTAEHRARQLERYVAEYRGQLSTSSAVVASAVNNRAPVGSRMKITIFGLSISSSWGNGHATLWRGLLQALASRGHRITFFEKDVSWYRSHRDLREIAGVELVLYPSWEDVFPVAQSHVADCDAAIVTSYCADSHSATELINNSHAARIFYDLDAPVTLCRVLAGETVDYVPARGYADFDLVLSYTGGRAIDGLKQILGAKQVVPLYGSVDPAIHHRVPPSERWCGDLSYLGTWAADRQAGVNRLLVEPARLRPGFRFVLGGAMYDGTFPWTQNIYFHQHVAPVDHASFYCSSRATLNVTREAMAHFGYCPSGRLFEAAACGAPIITDHWEGLHQFFTPGAEVVVARDSQDVLDALDQSPSELARIGLQARERALAEHTAAHRAVEFENALMSCAAVAEV